jgi:hypothetical protein
LQLENDTSAFQDLFMEEFINPIKITAQIGEFPVTISNNHFEAGI